VLLDVHLPDGDGIAYAKELTGADAAPRVLLTSSDAGAVPCRLLERCGAAGFVAKVDLAGADLTPYLG
jgi:response regulator of citrate/malate metabolism